MTLTPKDRQMDKNKKKIPTVQELRDYVSSEFRKQVEALGDSGIADRVRSILDEHIAVLIPTLMGLELDRWSGRWKVDHCNGRSGESAVGDFLRKRAGEKINEWLAEHAGKLPELTNSMTKELQSEYQSTLRRAIKEKVWKLAEARANELAAQIFSQVTP